jgi:hypothetical protein
MVFARLVFAIRADETNGRRSVSQNAHQIERVGSDPLEIVEQEERSSRACHISKEAHHRIIHQATFLLRRNGPGGKGLDRASGQLWEQANQPGAAGQVRAQAALGLALYVSLESLKQGSKRTLSASPQTSPC